jgi:hypothetical protein
MQFLNSRSIITITFVAFVFETGNFVIKSMDISLYWRLGIGNSFNNFRLFSFYTVLLPYMS